MTIDRIGIQAERQAGFTLLELMIIILILSVIMVIAVPAYQDYRLRAQAAELLMAVADVKIKVASHYMIAQTWPVDNQEAGLLAPAAYGNNAVQSVTVDNGVITVISDITNIVGQTLVFTPSYADTAVTWNCSGGTLLRQYRPARCR